jgi:hypothetical protein
MAETLALGRKGQIYVGTESAFGTPPTFTATDAVRHINFKPTRNPYNRVNSPEKKQSPGTAARFDRKETAAWSLEALLRPSGTLNTLSEADKILSAAFGGKTNITLSTTVSASPAPTTTTATVASASGLLAGMAVLITVGTAKYARFLTNVSTNALTWAPALPSAPATGAAVKGGCTYALTTDLAISLAISHFLTADTTHSKVVKGAVVDRFALAFGANEEAKWTASGPAKTVATPAATKPAAFTAVGTQNPPSGLVGGLYIGDAAYKCTKVDLEIQNGMALRLSSYGSSQAEEILPRGRRVITLALDALVGDEAVIYDNAESGTPLSVLKQTGGTEGNIIAIYAPRVDFDVPDIDDGDDVPTWPFKGVCLESADGANNELYLALL